MNRILLKVSEFVKKTGIVYIVASSIIFTGGFVAIVYDSLSNRVVGISGLLLPIPFILTFSLVVILEIVWVTFNCFQSEMDAISHILQRSWLARNLVAFVIVLTIFIITGYATFSFCDAYEQVIASAPIY